MGELTTPDRFLVGLDLGQRDDWTAVAIVAEHADRVRTLVALERIRHRPYPDIADLVADTVAALRWPELLVDVTGIGRPVCDLLTARAVRHRKISIHGGATVTTLDDGTLSIPKRDLIAALVVGFEARTLRIAAGLRHTETLEREAAAFQMKLTEFGHDSYSARSGEHDDLLLACSLPVWWGDRGALPFGWMDTQDEPETPDEHADRVVRRLARDDRWYRNPGGHP